MRNANESGAFKDDARHEKGQRCICSPDHEGQTALPLAGSTLHRSPNPSTRETLLAFQRQVSGLLKMQWLFIPAGKHHAGGGDAGIWENDAFSLSNFTAHKNENANPPKRLVPLRALGSTANTGMGRAGRSNLVTMNLLFKWLFLTAIGTRVWS